MRYDELEHIKSQRDRALNALKNVMALIDNKELCRDISRDHEATWPMRMMGLVRVLKEAQEVLAWSGDKNPMRPEGQ